MCLSKMMDFFHYNESFRGGNPNPDETSDACLESEEVRRSVQPGRASMIY